MYEWTFNTDFAYAADIDVYFYTFQCYTIMKK